MHYSLKQMIFAMDKNYIKLTTSGNENKHAYYSEENHHKI